MNDRFHRFFLFNFDLLELRCFRHVPSSVLRHFLSTFVQGGCNRLLEMHILLRDMRHKPMDNEHQSLLSILITDAAHVAVERES